ncbi:hypothetical protein B4N89_45945 [Embleya scabrispora]|uniref:Uncharacterized protein n=1 Tax=Embleya scabrispora TaxID=159449 RepID=A0A1T3NJ05_9ACTN|nr:hypothetical protein [Embleya scabrispora]OPC76819.1 hypothetical protein B4N89_45945 [Embleya scabrispora]
MTRYHRGDEFDSVTRGVLTLPLRRVDDKDTVLAYTVHAEQIDYADTIQALHPTVALAHREVLPCRAPSTARVEYTAPGTMHGFEDTLAWSTFVPEELGRLDADAHMFTLGDRERIAIRGDLIRRLDLPPIADLNDACAAWSPPLTLALVHDPGGIVPTDRGLFFTLLPPPTIVPLGYNLAALLAMRAADPGNPRDEALRERAADHYRTSLHQALTDAYPTHCACGRIPAEHEPTDEQLRRYLDIARGPHAIPA